MAKKTYRALAAESPAFRRACELAGVEPTRRQFAKFVKKRGRAWAAHVQYTLFSDTAFTGQNHNAN